MSKFEKLIKIILEEVEAVSADIQTNPGSQAAQQKQQQQAVNQSPQREKFNMDKFRKLGGFQQMLDYVRNTDLPYVGEGSTRKVYKIDSIHALKIALNEKGVAQNQAEAKVCTIHPDLFAKIISSDSAGNWLIVEFAAPMTTDAFKASTGMDWQQYTDAIKFAFPPSGQQPSPEQKNAFEAMRKNPFFVNLLATIKGCQYMPGDLIKLDSWGIVNNKAVIIDSGFTREIHAKFSSVSTPSTGSDVVTAPARKPAAQQN